MIGSLALSLTLYCVILAGIPLAYADVTPLRQQELLHLLKHDCGSCHGITLHGGLGAPLTPTALTGKSDQFLENIILHGLPSTAMPPWKGLLSREEIHWLVERMRKGSDQ